MPRDFAAKLALVSALEKLAHADAALDTLHERSCVGAAGADAGRAEREHRVWPCARDRHIRLGAGRTGYAVATQLDVRGIPFLFVTGYPPPTPLRWAAPVLTKPVDLHALAAALDQIGRARLHSGARA